MSRANPEAKYTVDVPAGIARLRVAMNGETIEGQSNDFDLFLMKGDTADPSRAVCKEDGKGQFAFCEVEKPGAGPWTILVRRKSGHGRFQVVATRLRP